MNQPLDHSWQDKLASIGADLEQLSSAKAVLTQDALQIIDRSDLSVVSFSGSEVGTFLQSQTCNDHEKVGPNSAQLNGYCSPKGRLLALPLVASDATGEIVYWLLPKDIVEATVKRLTMFVLRSDVQIKIESDWAVMGLACLEKAECSGLSAWVGEADAAPLSVWEANGHYGMKAKSAPGLQRSLLFGPQDVLIGSLKKCTDAIAADAPKPVWSSAASWWWGDVDAGVPSITAATQDSFVPQMVNLEPLDGLSFTKGCYPGQEIVARMQYLGKLKRTMVRFTADAAFELSPGDSISAGDDQNAGEVVMHVNSDSTSNCLAVIKTSADQTTFNVNGSPLTVQTLPYA